MTTSTHGRQFPPEVLTPEEVRRLMNVFTGDRWACLRDRALIAVLYRTGLRVSEALALREKDVDPARHAVRVMRGKGGRSRTVGIDDGALHVLNQWLQRRSAMGYDAGQAIFCTAWGRAVAPGHVRRMLKRASEAAGIAKRVHPHGLRHTLAAELREEGIDIGVISKQLGHADIATTARYLDHIAPAAVLAAMMERGWGGGD